MSNKCCERCLVAEAGGAKYACDACPCHAKGVCITCYENGQTVGTCPHVAQNNMMNNRIHEIELVKDSKVGARAYCKKCGMETVAPKEVEWEKEFAKLWREGEARGYDTYDPIKLFIQTHFIPKERVENILASWAAGAEEINTMQSLKSLLSEDK